MTLDDMNVKWPNGWKIFRWMKNEHIDNKKLDELWIIWIKDDHMDENDQMDEKCTSKHCPKETEIGFFSLYISYQHDCFAHVMEFKAFGVAF